MSIAHDQHSTTQASADRAWSPIELLRKVDNDIDLATELVEIFLEDAPEMSYDVTMAARSGDPERLAHAAHAYKGSAVAIGAIEVGRAAGALEVAGRDGHADVALELACFQKLEHRLIDELTAAQNDC